MKLSPKRRQFKGVFVIRKLADERAITLRKKREMKMYVNTKHNFKKPENNSHELQRPSLTYKQQMKVTIQN